MNTLDAIRRAAFQILARRDHTQYEITQKLKNAQYAPSDIALVVANLVENKVIDDVRFLENYIRIRKAKGYGPLRIMMELEARGIPSSMIAEAIKITDNAWVITILKTWQKHFKAKMPIDLKSKVKQMRFLHYRGFTQEQINEIFKDI